MRKGVAGEGQRLDGASPVNCWSSPALERRGHQIGCHHFEAPLTLNLSLFISPSLPSVSLSLFFSPLESMNHSCLFLPLSKVPLKKKRSHGKEDGKKEEKRHLPCTKACLYWTFLLLCVVDYHRC